MQSIKETIEFWYLKSLSIFLSDILLEAEKVNSISSVKEMVR